MLSQKTTISFGLILAIIVVLSALFTMIAPNVVTKAELEASQKTVTVQITSICNRIDRLDTELHKRFDKLEFKLDTLRK